MHPRRRYIRGGSDKSPLLTPDETYDKTDKNKQSYNSKPHDKNGKSTNPSLVYESLDNIVSSFLDEPVIEPVMAARDRTNEFINLSRSLQGRISIRPSVRDDRRALLETYFQFMNMAKVINKNITKTYAKLEKLAILAKKKSLFDDRPTEIQELTYIIKGDLNALNQQIARVGNMPKGRQNVYNHLSSVVLALQSRLASMSNQFKQVLEMRSENLKHQNIRREQFSRITPVVKEVPPLLQQEDFNIDLYDSGSSFQTQQMAIRDDTDTYVQQRAETMQNIESTIVELGGIFQQLAHMVKEQDEAIGRIDANIQEAEMNVEIGHKEIMKYFQKITGNRALMFKIFGVLIFFFIFFVVVMA